MKKVKDFSSRTKIIVIHNLNLLTESNPRNEYEKVPIRAEVKKLISEAVRECIRNGLTPDCAIDGEGGASSEITSINELEIFDLLKKLEKIKGRKALK